MGTSCSETSGATRHDHFIFTTQFSVTTRGESLISLRCRPQQDERRHDVGKAGGAAPTSYLWTDRSPRKDGGHGPVVDCSQAAD